MRNEAKKTIYDTISYLTREKKNHDKIEGKSKKATKCSIMDNTRVIIPNGKVPYTAVNEKFLNKAANMQTQKNVAHQKAFLNSVPSKSICNATGPILSMNGPSIFAATSYQFIGKISSSKSTMIPPYKIENHTSFGPTTAVWQAVMSKSIDIFSNRNTTMKTPELVINKHQTELHLNSFASEFENHSKLFGGSGMEKETSEGNPFVKKIKNIFTSIFKPLIDTTTSLVAGDSQIHQQPHQVFWSDSSNGSPISPHNHKSTSMYCDNQSSDSFCSYSDKSNSFMNSSYPPETFFDCDDFIDGGEDTIDFVADSTRYCSSFTDEFNEPSPKDNIFYDCVNKFGFEVTPTKLKVPDACEAKIELENTTHETSKSNKESECKFDSKSDDSKIDIVQYSDDKSPIICPKSKQPNKQSYRRKRKTKRKNNNNKSNGRQHKGMGANKNHHEKIRHEVAMNIHDDIDDCSIVKNGYIPASYDHDDDDDDLEIDLEIIDVDEHFSPKNTKSNSPSTSMPAVAATNVPVTTKSTPAAQKSDLNSRPCIEMPIPSPEDIPSGCIFTRFFRLDGPNCRQKQQMLQSRCMPKQVPQQIKPMKERSISCHRLSETESDDSFIVFEDSSPRSTTSSVDDLNLRIAALKDSYKRQRQLSECSDDFILFTDDVEDCNYRYNCTTDEDFTDSTDDSDDGNG